MTCEKCRHWHHDGHQYGYCREIVRVMPGIEPMVLVRVEVEHLRTHKDFSCKLFEAEQTTADREQRKN